MSWRINFHGHVDLLEGAINQQVNALKEGREEIEIRHLEAVADSIKKIANERAEGINTATLEIGGHADTSHTNVNGTFMLSKGF